MNTVLIAGAGQLGSRHLQGVKTSKHELDIWVYDLSDESLKIAEERYNQVGSKNKMVHFVTSLEFVPDNLDVVIVASGSKPRATIVKQILASKSVKYMVLEKFLFTRLAEYDEIGDLLKENRVKTWVNCTRRMQEIYAYVKGLINPDMRVEYSFGAEDWGLCCNSIHHIDMFMCLSNQKTYNINIDGLLPEIFESKRNGYIELRGTEIFSTERGDKLTLTSVCNYKGPDGVYIKNGNDTIIIDEINGRVSVNGIEKDIPIQFQSALSGILVDNILDTGECKLTPYSVSAEYHKIYLSTIMSFVNKIKGWASDSCPIT